MHPRSRGRERDLDLDAVGTDPGADAPQPPVTPATLWLSIVALMLSGLVPPESTPPLPALALPRKLPGPPPAVSSSA